jgi:hypothetical protein
VRREVVNDLKINADFLYLIRNWLRMARRNRKINTADINVCVILRKMMLSGMTGMSSWSAPLSTHLSFGHKGRHLRTSR